MASVANELDIVGGQTYTVSWDGTEYQCVCVDDGKYAMLGNLSIAGRGDDTGEPFVYYAKAFGTLDTSASHTISVKTTEETVTPMSAEFIPHMNVSAFTNDAGYLTSHPDISDKQDKLIAGENITIAADGKTISATGVGGGVQPDWNQNDSTAADYVKNRPFYTGNPVENVLVEENTVPFEGGGDLYMGMLPQVVPVIAGETYKVYWDSTAYECTCVNSEGMSILGNLSIPGFGSDTGEPFVLAVNISEETTEIYTTDTSATHTISISGLVPEIVKIDKKYLPFDIPTKTSQLENDAGYLTIATLPKYEGVVE